MRQRAHGSGGLLTPGSAGQDGFARAAGGEGEGRAEETGAERVMLGVSVAALAACGTLAVAVTVGAPGPGLDTVEHMHVVWLLRRGAVMYKEFFAHHMPLYYELLDAVVPRATAVGMCKAAQWLHGLAVLAAAGLWAASWRQWSGGGVWVGVLVAAMVLSHPHLIVMEARPDILQPVFLAGAVWSWLVALRRPPPQWGLAAFAGLLAGTAYAVQLKNPGPLIAAVIVAIVARRADLILGPLAGACLPVLWTVAYVATRGGLDEFVTWVVRYNSLMAEWIPWNFAPGRTARIVGVTLAAALVERRFRPLAVMVVTSWIFVGYGTWPNLAAPGLMYFLELSALAAVLAWLARHRAPAARVAAVVIGVGVLGWPGWRGSAAAQARAVWSDFQRAHSRRLSWRLLSTLEQAAGGESVLTPHMHHPVTAPDLFPFMWHRGLCAMLLGPEELGSLREASSFWASRWPRLHPFLVRNLPRGRWPQGYLPPIVDERIAYDTVAWLEAAIGEGLVRGITPQGLAAMLREHYRPLVTPRGVIYIRRDRLVLE